MTPKNDVAYQNAVKAAVEAAPPLDDARGTRVWHALARPEGASPAVPPKPQETLDQDSTLAAEVMLVTPEIAERFLGKNTHNRKFSRSNLAKLRASLELNEWQLNGEAIKIATDGTVLDGQHRLRAVVETGISITSLVVTGLPANTQESMDQGAGRSLADVLSLAGYTRANALAAAVSAIIRADRYGLGAASLNYYAQPVTVPQAMARLEAEPEIADICRRVKPLSRIGLPGRLAAVLHYTFAAIDADDTEYFFDKLQTGESLDQGNPILVLRNTLLSSRDSKGSKNPRYISAITVKAWNKFRDGDTNVGHLRFTPGGAKPEKFPEPR